MEWGDFSYLIFSSSHERLQFSPFLSISTAFLWFHFVFSVAQMFGGQSAVTAVQTGGPKPPRYFLSLFTFLSQCSPSLLSLSIFPSCLAHRTGLDLVFLSAACIWMVLCARLGLGPDVRAWEWVFVSLRENVITLQFVSLKLAWLRLPKSATLKFQPSRFRKSLYPVEDCISK